MNRRETSAEAPHPPIELGPTFTSHQVTVSRSDPPVKPTSEVAHQPGQQQTSGECPVCTGEIEECIELGSHAWVTCRGCGQEMRPQWGTCIDCGEQLPPLIQGSAEEVQRGEIKSAPETRCGARGGTHEPARYKDD